MIPVTGATRVAGVVGAPIAHSLSPVIHNAWIAAANIDAVYVPFEPDPERFEGFIDGLRGSGVLGLNVTAPFKEGALHIADEADVSATAAGSANLLILRRDGSIKGYNTDGAGLLAAFAEQAPQWRPAARPTVVLGAGGAARGAVAALVAAGGEVRVVNRTMERGRRLAADFPRVEPLGIGDMRRACADAGAIVSTLPSGVNDFPPPVAFLEASSPDAVIMDMIYSPLRTPLLMEAARRGRATVDGLAMLIGQARPSFEAMFAMPVPDKPDVRRIVLGHLSRNP